MLPSPWDGLLSQTYKVMHVPNPPFRTVTEELLYNIYLKLQGGGNMPGLKKDDINTLAKLNGILQDSELMSAEQVAGAIAALKGDVPEVANSLEKLYNIVQGVEDLAEALLALNLKRRTIQFYFADDHWKEGHHHHHAGNTYVLRGRINSLGEDFTDELSGVTYETRIDTSRSWVQHSHLELLQSWINTNVIGNEEERTKYWVRCLPVYKQGRDGEAMSTLTFDVY